MKFVEKDNDKKQTADIDRNGHDHILASLFFSW